jgi:MFS family permease
LSTQNDNQPFEAERLLKHAQEELVRADNKAAALVAGLGIGFGAVFGGLMSGNWQPGDLGNGKWLWYIGAVLAIVSVVAAGYAIWPRWDSDKARLHYWADIAQHEDFKDFERLVAKGKFTPQQPLNQLHVVSRIVRVKYISVRCSMGLAVAASIFVFFSVLI